MFPILIWIANLFILDYQFSGQKIIMEFCLLQSLIIQSAYCTITHALSRETLQTPVCISNDESEIQENYQCAHIAFIGFEWEIATTWTTGHLITYSTTVSKSFLCNRCSSRSNTSCSSSFYFAHAIQGPRLKLIIGQTRFVKLLK